MKEAEPFIIWPASQLSCPAGIHRNDIDHQVGGGVAPGQPLGDHPGSDRSHHAFLIQGRQRRSGFRRRIDVKGSIGLPWGLIVGRTVG